jgi:host factor-I protein
MTKPQVNLQDAFLNQVRKENMGVVIYLINGAQIKGMVRGFDQFTVVLESQGRLQLVYKHAIASVVPTKPIPAMNSESASRERAHIQ